MKYFYSVKNEICEETKIKRSIFIAHLQYVETMQAAKKYITEIGEKHKNANHNCWAYVVGEKGETFHSSDAGEPAGTAGRPILNTLLKHKTTNIVAVVTRYFGGVKLGVRGLIDAYGSVTETAINSNSLFKLVKLSEFKILTTYDLAEQLKYQIEKLNGNIKNVNYAEKVSLEISIETHPKNELEKYLAELEKAGKLTFTN